MAKAKKKIDKSEKEKKSKIISQNDVKKAVRKKNSIIKIFALLMAVVFMSSTLLLLIGGLPTLVAFLVDRSERKTKALTVGAMNLAGCFPFLLEMWTQDRSISFALGLLSNPINIVIMYFAAAVGYLLEWAMSGAVASILYQRGGVRKKEIIKRQERLVERWGIEVTGKYMLDQDGFALDVGRERTAESGEHTA